MYEKYDNNIKDIIAAQSGNEKAMEKLINSNKGLIWSIVNRFKSRRFISNSNDWIYKMY